MTVGSSRNGRATAPVSAGLTLVEVLVALAVSAVVLGLVGSLLGSARAASTAQAMATQPDRALDLAAELLTEEIGLAAFRPWRSLSEENGPEVVLTPVASGHAVQLSFVDDRLEGPAVERSLTFDAREDGDGAHQLYRRSGGASRQPLVSGIAAVVVESLVTASGELVEPVAGALHSDVRGLVLSLEGESGASRLVIVPTGARPTVEVRE
ncbi:MAG TPA: prepilin-type N-terminal cleavage/methylation domain-containing protein [Trueperaceae bacterium]|nr:prepilin-type N-terminal cleavage/methylation domain-containing protein [Trueperaceae bacterium]